MNYNQKYILKYLKEHDTISGRISVNGVLKELHPNVDTTNFERVQYEAGLIKAELSWLKKNGYIDYSSNMLGVGNRNEGYKWIEGKNVAEVKAELTAIGREFLLKEEQKGDERLLFESTLSTNQSIRDLNFATIKNTTFYKRAQIWNIVTMILTGLFIAISTWTSCEQLPDKGSSSSSTKQHPKLIPTKEKKEPLTVIATT